MLAPKQNLPADQRRLVSLYKQLPDQDKASLIAFAEFLLTRSEPIVEEKTREEPNPLPRPDEESVVGAIKRLSESYHMLDKSELFNETSTLMTSHIIQGRAAADVIDELESLFEIHYQRYCDKF